MTLALVATGRGELELFHFSRTLVSSIYGNSDARRDIDALLPYVADGRLDLGATVTDRITLADVPAAFDRMQRGEGGRALVAFPPYDRHSPPSDQHGPPYDQENP